MEPNWPATQEGLVDCQNPHAEPVNEPGGSTFWSRIMQWINFCLVWKSERTVWLKLPHNMMKKHLIWFKTPCAPLSSVTPPDPRNNGDRSFIESCKTESGIGTVEQESGIDGANGLVECRGTMRKK